MTHALKCSHKNREPQSNWVVFQAAKPQSGIKLLRIWGELTDLSYMKTAADSSTASICQKSKCERMISDFETNAWDLTNQNWEKKKWYSIPDGCQDDRCPTSFVCKILSFYLCQFRRRSNMKERAASRTNLRQSIH